MAVIARSAPACSSFAASLVLLSWALGASAARAQPSPQVTSEIFCNEDDDCPEHDGLCLANWFPGCGCDEGLGRCDANPRGCDVQSDCFGQEVCSTDGRCVEPKGSRSGQLCNVDDDCRPWLRCLGGACGAVLCAVDGDCLDDLVCENTRCLAPRCEEDQDCRIGQLCREDPVRPGLHRCIATQCVADDDCGDTAVCRDGSCAAVECRSTAQCRGCELCDVTNRCVSRCEADQRCASFVAVEPGAVGSFTIVSRCVDGSSRTCARDFDCERGQRCLGSRCIRTPDVLRDLDRFLRRPPDLDPKPTPTPRPVPPP